MPIRNVLVCGATGHLGTYLTNGLLESRHDFDVSILLRETSAQEPSKKAIVQVLESRGANVVFVPDISYTVEGLTVSLQGFDCVLSVVGTPTVDCQYILLEAAKRAGEMLHVVSQGFDSPTPRFDWEGWFDFAECVQYIVSQGWATVDNAWNIARGE
ncbi:hypothetical protein WJX75_007062 [Coccomyxa subellipsoidea]|uniref:NmrA-like domain-containing protein n=1 Tax=Coccomyxa subellipsoidea TaxID=248742 RepID=A0ABR2Z0J0_9CHLO